MNQIPEFIQDRLNEINKYKNNEIPVPEIKVDDIWAMNPKRLFPDSPTLQKYFIEVRDNKGKKGYNG